MPTHRSRRDQPVPTRDQPAPRRTPAAGSGHERMLSLQRRVGNRSVSDIVAAPRSTDSVTVQRVPGPRPPVAPAGGLDRSKVVLGEVADIVVDRTATPTFPAQTVTATMTDAAIVSLIWELYDPNDVLQPGAITTVPTAADAITRPFVVSPATFPAIPHGRSRLRCIGRNAQGQTVAYADRTFFVWANTEPMSNRDLAELTSLRADPNASFGEVGAADARSMMLEHRASIAATGIGKYMGNDNTPPAPAGVTKEDCTTYVLKVLERTFAAKGQSAVWQAVFNEANQASAGRLKGTELLKSLESQAGWKAVFWSPDPRNPRDRTPEHPSAYRQTQARGKYYGIDVDNTKSVVNYRRTDPTPVEEFTHLDQLRNVPLGVIAARGGWHMTLLINGQVYEVHWDRLPTDPNVIEAVPLERWAWQSGVVVMPAEDFTRAFAP